MTLHANILSDLLRGPVRGLRAVLRPALAERYARREAPARRSSGRASSPVRRTLFHAPSFSAGVVMGAVVVLGAAYLPELLGGPVRDPGLPAAPADTRPKLTFEFDHLLRNSEVAADPEPYHSAPRVRTSPMAADASVPVSEPMTNAEAVQNVAVPRVDPAVTEEPAVSIAPAAAAPAMVPVAEPAAPVAAETFTLQAASFRSADDANRLRAALLLMDLPATMTTSSLGDGVWYRVSVGPFSDRAEAERAMSRLREQNIAAIWSRG
jgi:cell division septation protein DedD